MTKTQWVEPNHQGPEIQSLSVCVALLQYKTSKEPEIIYHVKHVKGVEMVERS